ncbi:MAG: uroporphyrinogen decarboxylase family protein [Anaerolineae bacterium]|nr:uroporphyrinogen decarboxylase family protein [Anaerolineae bacterium]
MTDTMTSRERVLAALNHQEPDRVPVAFDSPECSIHRRAHRRLLDYLGLEGGEETLIDRTLQVVRPDDRLKRRLRTDTYCVVLGEGPITLDSDGTAYTDEWGIRLQAGGEWFNVVDSPLKEGTLEELRAHPIPTHARARGRQASPTRRAPLPRPGTSSTPGAVGSLRDFLKPARRDQPVHGHGSQPRLRRGAGRARAGAPLRVLRGAS